MPNAKKPVDVLGQRPYNEWPDLITPGELAALFRVDPKTVGRWGNDPTKIPKKHIRQTVGGHKRYTKEFVYELLHGEPPPSDD